MKQQLLSESDIPETSQSGLEINYPTTSTNIRCQSEHFNNFINIHIVSKFLTVWFIYLYLIKGLFKLCPCCVLWLISSSVTAWQFLFLFPACWWDDSDQLFWRVWQLSPDWELKPCWCVPVMVNQVWGPPFQKAYIEVENDTPSLLLPHPAAGVFQGSSPPPPFIFGGRLLVVGSP